MSGFWYTLGAILCQSDDLIKNGGEARGLWVWLCIGFVVLGLDGRELLILWVLAIESELVLMLHSSSSYAKKLPVDETEPLSGFWLVAWLESILLALALGFIAGFIGRGEAELFIFNFVGGTMFWSAPGRETNFFAFIMIGLDYERVMTLTGKCTRWISPWWVSLWCRACVTHVGQ